MCFPFKHPSLPALNSLSHTLRCLRYKNHSFLFVRQVTFVHIYNNYYFFITECRNSDFFLFFVLKLAAAPLFIYGLEFEREGKWQKE